MSDLVGAWSLTETAVAHGLGPAARRAMKRQLVGGAHREIESQRLWLVAADDKLRERGDEIVAWEGFVAGDLDDAPDGHLVLVRARGPQLSLVRALSGGERLYFTRVGDLLLFAASIRPLLAHPDVVRALDADVTDEVLLTGHPVFGDRTPVRGISEVLPGHRAEIEDGRIVQRWHWPDALRSPAGDPARLARRFREALCVAVEKAIGRARPVAIALSGGIDSSAIAAAAVEVVGPSAVHAFTYEFDDPTHRAPETDYARQVATALGITRHDVFRVGFREFLDAMPEHVWRSESAVHWPKAFLLPVARTFAAHGYDRYLSGFGIGSHMGFLEELARVLPWIPAPSRTLKYWRRVRFDAWDWLLRLGALHPGLEPPHPRLYDLLLQVLERRGIIDDRRRFYPEPMHALLQRRREASETLLDLVDDDTPLHEALQRLAFSHLVSCIDVTRSEKASREVGACRVSPAHFAGCIPYAYFPIRPPPPLWSAARRLRPGKHLLRLAYAGVLPDSVLYRKKSWDDAVTSRAWRKRGRVFMLRALPRFPGEMRELGAAHPDAIEFWEPTAIQANCLSFWFWHELFVRRPPRPDPPTWQELWGYSAADVRLAD